MQKLLSDDHAQLGELLGSLLSALEGSDMEQVKALLDLFWARLAMHIRAEHLHLFPAVLRALSDPSMRNLGDGIPFSQAAEMVEKLRADHDFFMRELAAAMKAVRTLGGPIDQQSVARELDRVRSRVVAVSERLLIHNESEENYVYPWAETFIPDAEKPAWRGLLQAELENMPPRFDT
jgi:hemerythrin superfamily protein